MPEITVYTRRFCAYCTAAKSLLQSNGYEFAEVNLDQDPQIFVGETSVGGFQELHAAINSGEFAELMEPG